MSDPSLELQALIVARLKADPAVNALIGQRIYDAVPEGAAFPYVSFGPEQIIPDNADCIPGSEIILQIDAWSRAVGFPEVKRIADAVRRSLQADDLAVADNALVSFEFDDRRVLRDPDGLSSHAVIRFRAVVEQR